MHCGVAGAYLIKSEFSVFCTFMNEYPRYKAIASNSVNSAHHLKKSLRDALLLEVRSLATYLDLCIFVKQYRYRPDSVIQQNGDGASEVLQQSSKHMTCSFYSYFGKMCAFAENPVRICIP